MAFASFSSHPSMVRSTSYSRANQSISKRLVCTSLVSHVTTLLMVLSSTMKALISICSPPFPGQVDLLLPVLLEWAVGRSTTFRLVGSHVANNTPLGILDDAYR